MHDGIAPVRKQRGRHHCMATPYGKAELESMATCSQAQFKEKGSDLKVRGCVCSG